MVMSKSPTSSPVRGCTCYRLRQLTRRVTAHYDAYLSQAGLRTTQYSLLSMLVKPEPLTLTELAARLEMDRTTLTRNLRPLEDAGWVQVTEGKDARSRSVRLTESGRHTWEQAKPYWRAAQDSLNATLGLEQVGQLHELLDTSLEKISA